METRTHKKVVQKYYSVRSREYDQQKSRTWKSERGFGAEVINETLDALRGLEDKLLLEVGIGSGRIGLPLLETVNPRLIGLDLSLQMLELARKKMSLYKQKLDLILGDADHLPFIKGVFDALVCISTMHYFTSYERSLAEFSRVLKENGVFLYGDVSIHELDKHSFLDRLEKTLSKAHARYYKPSEMVKMLENQGFHVSKMKTIAYRKSYQSLMEDKAKFFDIEPEALHKLVQQATKDERKLYSMDDKELTLFYTLIRGLKEGES